MKENKRTRLCLAHRVTNKSIRKITLITRHLYHKQDSSSLKALTLATGANTNAARLPFLETAQYIKLDNKILNLTASKLLNANG